MCGAMGSDQRWVMATPSPTRDRSRPGECAPWRPAEPGRGAKGVAAAPPPQGRGGAFRGPPFRRGGGTLVAFHPLDDGGERRVETDAVGGRAVRACSWESAALNPSGGRADSTARACPRHRGAEGSPSTPPGERGPRRRPAPPSQGSGSGVQEGSPLGGAVRAVTDEEAVAAVASPDVEFEAAVAEVEREGACLRVHDVDGLAADGQLELLPEDERVVRPGVQASGGPARFTCREPRRARASGLLGPVWRGRPSCR